MAIPVSVSINTLIRIELAKLDGKFTAETMAKAVHRAVVQCAEFEGQRAAVETTIRKPGETRHFADTTCWVVAWEAGPYEWAISASMLIGEITGKVVEPFYSFDLCFYPSED